jgi:3,4-dihydroxy-9,10-secoandrosta-1,3,5(10)-triene-9,17-dione 4,5-dioxygenase
VNDTRGNEINALGYVGFDVPDPAAWLRFGCEMLGAMPARALPGESFAAPMDPNAAGPASGGRGLAEDGASYLKLDRRQWRIAAHPAERPGLRYLGLETRGRREFERAIVSIEKAGGQLQLERAEAARARGVAALASLSDPAGYRIELFHGAVDDFKFQSPTGTRFVTGDETGDLGLGHVNLFVPDMEASLDFYIGVLGFRLSDFMNFGPGLSVQFLHCNARHHSIALVKVGDVTGVHHLMLEVEDVDQVGEALDRTETLGVPITSTLGRHRNDGILSFYMQGPGGFEVEIGCGGVRVDERWSAREFCEGDVWGHKGLTPEAITEASEKLR